MADEKDQSSLGALIATAAAGLPGALSKSALGALNRLIAGATDIPATYLAGFKERLEDKNYERRQFGRALTDAAANKAAADPQLVDRTVERLLHDQMRKQTNREAIARQAVPLLADAPTEESQGAIDDDWLSSFEKFAEDASSERMRGLWARVLAGELIKPGSFSRGTLRFFHELDKDTGDAFEIIAQHVLGRHVFAGDDPDASLFGKMLHLEALGVLSGAAGIIHYQARTDDAGRFFIPSGEFTLVGLAAPDSIVNIDATPLTKVGQELLKIVPNKDEEKTVVSLAHHLEKPNPLRQVAIRGVALAKSEGTNVRHLRLLWGDNPFELPKVVS